MKIYTKTGDKGFTALIGGRRVPKNHYRIEAYGSMDELISTIGLLREMYPNKHYYDLLIHIQDRLMVSASLLAAEADNNEINLPQLKMADIELLEKEIDKMEIKLPPLKNFILPGGNKTVAVCHITRTVCRRVERLCINLLEEDNKLDVILKYLNRLSDFFFVLSRYISMETNSKEIPWKPEL